ncbi:hypothetical protein JQ633_07545 [Bradyrhizobium tropiciagri]|uniref:hypothetical protein n=1 Tax=Bradyrhizobium tropiciagri TaxID=312253 RepID=UPI001BA6FDA6|nr:hypothetical protein [Bradyrhizobium tropiciagri]
MEIGSAAALVNALPGADVHELPGVELPRAGAGATVPVVLLVTDPSMATGIAGDKAGGGLSPVAEIGFRLVDAGEFVDVTLNTDGESSTVVGAQFTLVPGSVGSCASGGEASVVAGAPGIVAAENRLENGLGPVSGEDTIAPGVVAIPMAVVPRVETWAWQLTVFSRIATVAQKRWRIRKLSASDVCADVGSAIEKSNSRFGLLPNDGTRRCVS